jgi:hypothetical protein
VNNYLTRWNFSPSSTSLSFGIEKPTPSPAIPFNWSYCFSDGSRLEGKVWGKLNREGKRLLNPTQIEVDYLDSDGKTVLETWQGKDFACFEATVDGSDTVIVASNDQFTANSMCLVNCPTRSRSQVTEAGSQMIGEPFQAHTWSLNSVPASVPILEPEIGLDFAFAPFFPFLSFSINLRPAQSKRIYQWTFSPYLPFYPFLRVMSIAYQV